MIRLLREDGMVPPSLINVFKDHKGLSKRSSVVDKHRHLLVNRVVFEKKITLVSKIFFKVGVLDSLQFEGYLDPYSIWASSHTKQLNISVVIGHCRVRNSTFCATAILNGFEQLMDGKCMTAAPLKKLKIFGKAN